MEITRRCDYAIRIMRCAYKHQDEYVSIADVADEEGIPYAFARTIQHDLSMAGYIKTIRGAHGGLMLSVDPATITLADVLEKFQGNISTAPCSEDPSICEKSPSCSINRVWVAADNILKTFFGSLTLKDVLEGDLKGEFLYKAKENANDVAHETLSSLLEHGAPETCALAGAQVNHMVRDMKN